MLWKIKVCPVTSLLQFPVTLGLLVLHTCKCYSHTVLLSPASSMSASQGPYFYEAGQNRHHSIPVVKQYNNACSPWSWTKLRFPGSFWLPGAFPPSWPSGSLVFIRIWHQILKNVLFVLFLAELHILWYWTNKWLWTTIIQPYRCLQSTLKRKLYILRIEATITGLLHSTGMNAMKIARIYKTVGYDSLVDPVFMPLKLY